MNKSNARIFLIEDAVRYGTDEAIFLFNLKFWIKLNKEKKSKYHLKEGRYWMWNTRKDFTKLFPFWTEQQLERISKNLLKQNAILCGSFNKRGYDRTIWYTINNESSLSGDTKSHSPNGELEFANPLDPFKQIVEPIPDVNDKYKPSDIDISAAESGFDSNFLVSEKQAKEEKEGKPNFSLVEVLTTKEMLSLAEYKTFDDKDMAFLTNIVDVPAEGLSKKQVVRLEKIRARALKAKQIDKFRPMDQETIDELYEIYLKKEKAKLQLSALDDGDLYYKYGVRQFGIEPIDGESIASFRKRCEIEIDLGNCI